jgi:GTP cyclohydrolase II
MEDGHGGDETGGCNDENSNINGDYYNLGVSSATTPVNGKSQPFVKKNTKVIPNQIRLSNGSVAVATATRMPPVSIRNNNNNNNGFGNHRSVNGATAAVAAVTLDKKPASTTTATAVVGPMGMPKGVVIQKTGLPFGSSSAGSVVGSEAEFVDQPIPAEFVAETALPTDVGQFRLRAYRTDPDPVNEFTGREPTVIYAADKSPFGKGNGQLQENIPIRIHDQCLTSEVFRSQR